MKESLFRKTIVVQYVGEGERILKPISVSITTTKQEKLEDFYVSSATGKSLEDIGITGYFFELAHTYKDRIPESSPTK